MTSTVRHEAPGAAVALSWSLKRLLMSPSPCSQPAAIASNHADEASKISENYLLVEIPIGRLFLMAPPGRAGKTLRSRPQAAGENWRDRCLTDRYRAAVSARARIRGKAPSTHNDR